MQQNPLKNIEGILPVNKPTGKTAFSLVASLRRILKVKKIGHAGTLDPFATGVMVMLIGRSYTQLSDQFLSSDKEYQAQILLGAATDTYDCDGAIVETSAIIPTQAEVEAAIAKFQGEIEQIPPMYSAKKVNGKKLYELARQGRTVERASVKLQVETTLLRYCYPYIDINVNCSKGTYIRSIAHDLGKILGCGGHLVRLQRTRSGSFHLDECLDGSLLFGPLPDINCLCAKMKKYENNSQFV